MSETTELGRSGKVATVHKNDCEGGLQIDAISGLIVTPLDERPDWAEGLAVAQLAERHGFYTKRLGEQYANEHKSPDLFNFADLAWLGVDAEGEEIELAADEEFRMEVLGSILGTEREATTGEGEAVLSGGIAEGGTITVAELNMDNERSPEEIKAFQEAQQQKGFEEHRASSAG